MLRLYMDVHVKAAITAGVRRRGIDVITAQENGATRLEDASLLDRTTALGSVLFSQDDDLLALAREHQTQGIFFVGLIYGHQLAATIGKYGLASRSSLQGASSRGYGESDRISPLGLGSLLLYAIFETFLRWPQPSPWVTHRAAPGSILPASRCKKTFILPIEQYREGEGITHQGTTQQEQPHRRRFRWLSAQAGFNFFLVLFTGALVWTS